MKKIKKKQSDYFDIEMYRNDDGHFKMENMSQKYGKHVNLYELFVCVGY